MDIMIIILNLHDTKIVSMMITCMISQFCWSNTTCNDQKMALFNRRRFKSKECTAIHVLTYTANCVHSAHRPILYMAELLNLFAAQAL